MNYMVNMMREHVPQETRIHYVITRGGGAPNVVPDFAEAYYYARQPNMRILDGIWERIVDAAKGAALGTGTTMELEVTGAVYNVLPNDYLSGVMHANLERVGGFTYTPEEAKFAEEIRKTLTDPPDVAVGSQEKVRPMRTGAVNSSSTDLADVSWNVPTVSVTGATFAPGVPAHSWQATACAGSTIGVKGMMVGREGDGADDGRSVHRSGAHPEGEGGVRPEARARVRLQNAARRSQAGAGLPQVTALITGASSGIGLELARIFAANRHDVVLVARSEGKLRELARECESERRHARTWSPPIWRSRTARASIVESVARLGLEIDILVNNAGFGVYGRFVETPLRHGARIDSGQRRGADRADQAVPARR